ncbi:MAG: hypothetical protein LBG15_11420 [Dysgonamonadaceae bacterium]|jgi:hypothetical protein|nr:hypothetical protein [Dysgonamonadaceae bacterium]
MKRKKLLYLLVLYLLSVQAGNAQLEAVKLVITDGIRNEKLKQTIEQNISGFLYACNTAVINDKKIELDKQATTNDARKRFLSIWNASPIACSVSTLERKCLIRPAGGYQIRDIPVTMYEAPEDEQNQEIVINLTADGKIDDVFIPITQYVDLISSGETTEDISLRMMVLDFVENYRTAYNRKEIDFIEAVFSDNAIIITGKEIKQKPKSDAALRSSLSSSQIEYQVKNKTQYISSLKRIFKKNRYINVAFDEIRVLQHENHPQVYGVTLKQDWRSGNHTENDYMDIGYVFLLIDFRDEEFPLIHVRTWQPEKYILNRDEVFQIGDFDLNRF